MTALTLSSQFSKLLEIFKEFTFCAPKVHSLNLILSMIQVIGVSTHPKHRLILLMREGMKDIPKLRKIGITYSLNLILSLIHVIGVSTHPTLGGRDDGITPKLRTG
jgi:uncharacterized membrane protein